MSRRPTIAIVLATFALALAACSGDSDPVVTPAPETVTVTEEPAEAPTLEPTETETEEVPERTGTRDAPLGLGETRKVVEGSAWTVGITASNLDALAVVLANNEYAEQPAEGERFVVATLQVTVDQAAIEAQGFEMSDGADPRFSLTVEYVAADGTSYGTGTGGTFCTTANDYLNTGVLYSDGAQSTGDVCVGVPADKIDGGLWRVSNGANDAVWVANA